MCTVILLNYKDLISRFAEIGNGFLVRKRIGIMVFRLLFGLMLGSLGTSFRYYPNGLKSPFHWILGLLTV